MRNTIVVISLILAASAAFAEQTLVEISWDKLQAQHRISAGEVLPPDAQTPFHQLKVVNATGRPSSALVLTLENPGITASTYAITGQVRYEGVEGKGYLEMRSAFPDGGSFFSRTLGAGPLSPLEGTSGWRRFALPFFLGKSAARPDKLILNVVLPSRGTVLLGPLRVVQYSPGENPLAVPGQWWSERTGGWVGTMMGLFGAVVGILGALTGWLVSRGKARGFIMGSWLVVMLLGIVSLSLGIVAVVKSQPYVVYYPLLLGGVLFVVLPAVLIPTIRKRYEESELRKMNARDLGQPRA